MKRFCRALVLTAFLLSLICSCTLPPYSDELSFAEVTAKKMEKVRSIGPLSMDDSGAINYHFIPDKVIAPTGGFFLIERSSSLDVRYIAQEGGPDVWNLYSGYGLNLIPNENNFRFFPAALKPYAYYNAWMALFPFSYGLSDILLRFSFDGSFQVNPPLPLKSNVEGVVGPIDNIVGLSVYPNADSTDRLHILGRVGTSYVEVAYSSLDTTGYSIPEDINLTARGLLSSQITPAIDGAANGFYFYDPATMRSFLSVYWENSHAYLNYAWYESGGALVTERLPFDGRIVSVLSTGELYVVSGNSGEVRTQSGTLKYSFPCGRLSFVHELYDTEDLCYRMYFTNWYAMEQKHSTEVYIDVYMLKTSDLSTLE